MRIGLFTTAAGVWTTAGIGMATGAGMYLLSIGAALMVIFAQFIMHIRCKLFTKDKNSIIKIDNRIKESKYKM